MTDTTKIKVGMVMTTYSTGGHRRELALTSIRSLLENTDMENRHLVVVDDRSTDGLQELLCQEFTNDERVSLLLKSKNCGVGRNKNEGVQFLRYGTPFENEEILYICDDDLLYQRGWMKYALKMFLDLEKTEELGMFGVWRHRCHPVRYNLTCPWDPRYSLLRVEELPGCGVFIRPDVYDRMGGWKYGREEDKRGDDLETTAAIRSLDLNLYAVTPPLVLHEGHMYANGKTVCFHEEQKAENLEWIPIYEF